VNRQLRESGRCIVVVNTENWKAHPTPTMEVSIPAGPLSDYDELLQMQEAVG
jgi:hypothetical protein